MSRRRYRLGRRAETAEATRRRIVEATFDLHARQGIAGTSMKQIAEHAGVSVGTVYHHFPSYSDAIRACGELTSTRVPLPDESVVADVEERSERVRRVARVLFEFYERLPAFEWVRREKEMDRTLEAYVAAEERNRLALVRRALGAKPDDERVPVIAALFDVGSFAAFRQRFPGRGRAAERVAAVANAWLAATGGKSDRKPGIQRGS